MFGGRVRQAQIQQCLIYNKCQSPYGQLWDIIRK